MSRLCSTSTSRGGRYDVKLDPFLIRYFRDCPGAWKNLERKLGLMVSSVQFDQDNGIVSVTGLGQTHSGSEEQRKVTQFFEDIKEKYICRHVLEADKIKSLLQARPSDQTEVWVYQDMGTAVVVGECSKVEARLKALEDSPVNYHQSKISPIKIGETKVRLLWENMQNELARLVPGVKVFQGDGDGYLFLEGTDEDIEKAQYWVSQKESKIIESVVSDVSPRLLAFLRKQYGVPGVLAALLGIDNDVEIDIAVTEVCLFSFFPKKLENAEKALRSEFREMEINVPNCSTVPMGLRARLEVKATEINHRGCRVEVKVGASSKIILLGHREDMRALIPEITPFIVDTVDDEAFVSLPFPEIEDSLPQLLQLLGFDYSGVDIHPAKSSSSSYSAVLLKGPDRQVTEVSSRLSSLLKSLVRASVIIEQPGALSYFQSASGSETLKNVGRTHKCLIKLADSCVRKRENWPRNETMKQGQRNLVSCHLEPQSHDCSPELQKESRALLDAGSKAPKADGIQRYSSGAIAGRQQAARDGNAVEAIQVEVIQGMIEKQQVDALVCPMLGIDPVSTSVGKTLSKLIKPPMIPAFQKVQKTLPGNSILVENLPGIASDRVFFLNLIPWDKDPKALAAQALRQAIESTFTSCGRKGIRSIATPILGSEPSLGFPPGVAAELLLEEILRFEKNQHKDPCVVRIVIPPDDMESIQALQTAQGSLHLRHLGVGANQANPGLNNGPDTLSPAKLCVVGYGPDAIKGSIKRDLEEILWQKQQIEAVEVEESQRFYAKEIESVRMKVRSLEVSVGPTRRKGDDCIAEPMTGPSRSKDDVLSTNKLERNVLEGLHRRAHQRDPNEMKTTDEHVALVNKPDRVQTQKEGSGIEDREATVSTDLRIVLLGKTGAGKSSIGNTLFKKPVFKAGDSPNSETNIYQLERGSVLGRKVTLIDTPGFFDTAMPEERLKCEVTKFITECIEGPHVFLIVLKVERYTCHEQEVIKKIYETFSADALKYAVVLFTHGDQLAEGETILDYVDSHSELKDLINKCGRRCHVIDNKYWNDSRERSYRSNQFQVAALLNTIDSLVKGNGGKCFTNDMLRALEEEMREEEAQIWKESPEKGKSEVRMMAKSSMYERILTRMSGVSAGMAFGAFLGAQLTFDRDVQYNMKAFRRIVTGVEHLNIDDLSQALKYLNIPFFSVYQIITANRYAIIIAGAIVGACLGYNAVEHVETPKGAVKAVINHISETDKILFEKIQNALKNMTKREFPGK